jgi:glycerophosphoryl diester phosphodiesterase
MVHMLSFFAHRRQEKGRAGERGEAGMPASDFMCIAHRGASAYAPENTLAAFDLALAMGIVHIELDVHCTRDGQVVIMHDETVKRTTNGTGPITSYTLAELR